MQFICGMSGPLFASLYEVEKIKLSTFFNNDLVAAISPIFCGCRNMKFLESVLVFSYALRWQPS